MTNVMCPATPHSLHEYAGIIPIYQTMGAACADLELPTDATIPARTAVKIDLLLSFDIPEGYKIVMYPRSSLLMKHNLIQPTSIIDSDYKGNVHAPLYNPTDTDIHLPKGTRVAQIECVPAYNTVQWPRKYTKRGNGGFGSTDK